MIKTTPEQNKTLVLQAFDTLFNKRDYNAAERYWSSNYIQHSAHIAPGRDGLFNLVRSTPPTLKYEPGLIVAENDYVIVHGRFSGLEGSEIGSPPMSSEWQTACSRSTGMFCRMKRPKRRREAVCRCSGPRFPVREAVAKQLVQFTQPEGSAQAKCSMARWGCRLLALPRHSKIGDERLLSEEERSCSRHHHHDRV
jgi:SnoaL-like domain